MAAKKTTLSELWLGDRLGYMVEQLAESGHDVSLITIGITKTGNVRILGDFDNPLTAYGALCIATNELYEQINTKEKKEG